MYIYIYIYIYRFNPRIYFRWSSCLPSLPPAHATRVLGALLPLVPLHAGFGRHLLLLLRKLLGSPEPRCRRLAVAGWCELLRRGLLRSQSHVSDPVSMVRMYISIYISIHGTTKIHYFAHEDILRASCCGEACCAHRPMHRTPPQAPPPWYAHVIYI